jgi:ClpP class serine protease
LKASPNTFEPVTPEAREAMASIVLDSYDWFKGLVRERRKLDDKELAAANAAVAAAAASAAVAAEQAAPAASEG